jgi:hypothetical protein
VNRLLCSAALAVAVSSSLVACGGSTSTDSGAVYMGPVAGANVAVYGLASDGSASPSAVATTTTRADGTFSLPRVQQYPVLVRVTNGTYSEEATGAQASLTEELDAVFLSAPSTMIVSAFSNAIVADARAAGGLTSDNVSAAQQRMSGFLGGVDPQQTTPTFVASGATANVSAGSTMALALGAESQSRTDGSLTIAQSTQNIMAQAANGDTLAACNSGAGNVSSDGSGTVLAAPDSQCALTEAAAAFAANPLNRSGITSVASLMPAASTPVQTATGTGAACGDRIAILRDNFALFAGRKSQVQATLVPGLKPAMTDANWSTYRTQSSWGPFAGQYGAIDAPATCTDIDAFKRELVMAVENYWVDQNINYCHHHVPGWTPPDDSSLKNPKYRNSTPESTSGDSVAGQKQVMTCTGQRNVDGTQSVKNSSTDTPVQLTADKVNWHGVDCSDFTAWVFNFAGLATNTVQTGIGTQACSTLPEGAAQIAQPGVLLDINHGNISTMQKYLMAGDLLYITQLKPVGGSGEFAPDYKLAHVITWTGKRYSELVASEDGARYNWHRIGQADSRLGGDFLTYLHFPPEQLGKTPETDPWMIVDSHYAGPAYRPFIGWYANSLSNVRRIIGSEAAKADPVLSQYVIKAISNNKAKTWYTLASDHAKAKAGSGWRMIYENVSGKEACYRAGDAN